MIRCLNCDTALEARFCPECGQENINLQRPLTELLAEVLHETFELDGRAARTIGTLFRRPGRLTAEYLAGHRKRYTPPFRLYLFFSIAFFVGIAWVVGKGTMLRDGQNLQTDALEQAQFISDELPRLIFLLLPIFALILKAVYRRRLYFDHLIHALHLHCVAFVALGLIIPLERIANQYWPLLILQTLPFFWLVAYLLVSLRTVYQSDWKISILKTGIVLSLYLMAVSAVLNLSRLLF